jgi:hypothetical protein
LAIGDWLSLPVYRLLTHNHTCSHPITPGF